MKMWGKVAIAVWLIAGVGAMAVAPFVPKWVQTSSAHSDLMGLEGFQRADFSVNMVSRGLPTVVVDFDGAIAPGTSQARQKELVHALLAVIDKHGLGTMDPPVLHLPNGTELILDLPRNGYGSDADLDSALGNVLSANAPWANLGTSKRVMLSLTDLLTEDQCRDPRVAPERFAALESRIRRTESVPVSTSVSCKHVYECPQIGSQRTVSDAELAAIAALPQWHRDNQARVTRYDAQFDQGKHLVVTVTVLQPDATVPNTLITGLAEAGMPVKLQSQGSLRSGAYQYVLVASS